MSEAVKTNNNHNQKETAMQDAHAHGLRRAARLLAVAALTLLGLAPPASAGEYTVNYCTFGSGPHEVNAWYQVGNTSPGVGCNSGAAYPWNGVYYNTPSLGLNGYGGLRSDAPTGARFKSLSVNLRVPYQATNRRTYVAANSSYVWSWWNGWGGTSSYNPDGNFFTVQLSNSGYWEIGQACHGAIGGCEAGDFYFSGLNATLVDDGTPAVAPHTGSGLLDAGRSAFRGTQTVTADLSDAGHGIVGAVVEVDGVGVPGSATSWGSSCSYRYLSPCPNRPNWSRDVNTASHSDGQHTVSVIADDGVGNTARYQRTVIFDNTPPALNGTAPFNGEAHSADSTSFDVSATDATSGVARVEANVDGGGWQTLGGVAGKVTVTGAGSHTVAVRAVDVAGNTTAEQVSTFTLQMVPDNQRVMTVSDQSLPGKPGPTDTVKCDAGTPWSQGTTFAYEWLRSGAVITGATGQTYTLVQADAERMLTCRVAGTNGAGKSVRTAPEVQTGTVRCFGHTAAEEPCGDFDGDNQDNASDEDDDNDGVPDPDDPDPFDPSNPGDGATGLTPVDPGPGSGGGGGSGSGGVAGVTTSALGTPNNGINASNKAQITLEGTRKRTVKYGRRIATVAHLRDELGRPIVGAKVAVLERMNVAGAQWLPAREPLVTDAKGRMRWLIPAKFSRTIRYAYKANLSNADFQATSDVVLTVFSKSTLKTSRKVARNGQTVVFGGRLMSRPLPRGGVLIDLQARVGRRWQTFKTVRARGAGKWRMAYTFRATRGVQTYKFRARVRQDSGYPYALSTTRAVAVKVIG